MRLVRAGLSGISVISTPALASEPDWILHPAADNVGEQLIYDPGGQFSYRFTCEKDDIAITQTGVTKLLDLTTNTKVGDGLGATMPKGAALMALYNGKDTPDFQPATAIKNPKGGWDLTIRLKKNDKQLKAVGSSEMISLFTTGYTAAVVIDTETKATWNGFLKRCQGAS